MSSATAPIKSAHCRSCGATLTHVFVDLGNMPLANAYLDSLDDAAREVRYPLRTRVCAACWLVQVDYNVPPEVLFGNYRYFASFSDSWLAHARRFADDAIERFNLSGESLVIELASNDGYLLKNFVARNIPVLGIDPSRAVAEAAIAAGVPTEIRFFDEDTADDLARRGITADLVVANNVLAHVPDPNGFIAGIAAILKPAGTVSIEVPHLLKLMVNTEFDTIYHEHYSYFSLLAIEHILSRHGLQAYDVIELPTHGGSLRVLAGHAGDETVPAEGAGLVKVRADERAAAIDRIESYERFAERVRACRESFRGFLAEARAAGKTIAAYGAAAKGNTFLNFCGVGPGDIAFVADRSPHKQGLLLPGTHIPIAAPERIEETEPDYVLILPWNLRDEITEQLECIRRWDGRFVVAVPETQVLA